MKGFARQKQSLKTGLCAYSHNCVDAIDDYKNQDRPGHMKIRKNNRKLKLTDSKEMETYELTDKEFHVLRNLSKL